MRPMNPSSWDAPNPKDLANPKCVEDWRAGGLESWDGNNFTGECRIKKSQRGCSEAYCGTNEHGQRVLLKSGQTKQWPKVKRVISCKSTLTRWKDHGQNIRTT